MAINVKLETLLTLPHAAKALDCSLDTVRRMVARGQLEAVRIAGRLRTSLEAIARASEPVEARKATRRASRKSHLDAKRELEAMGL